MVGLIGAHCSKNYFIWSKNLIVGKGEIANHPLLRNVHLEWTVEHNAEIVAAMIILAMVPFTSRLETFLNYNFLLFL